MMTDINQIYTAFVRRFGETMVPSVTRMQPFSFGAAPLMKIVAFRRHFGNHSSNHLLWRPYIFVHYIHVNLNYYYYYYRPGYAYNCHNFLIIDPILMKFSVLCLFDFSLSTQISFCWSGLVLSQLFVSAYSF